MDNYKLYLNSNNTELTELDKKRIKREFGEFKLCSKHKSVITGWRRVGPKAEERYICMKCYNYELTHHKGPIYNIPKQES